jgi:hypothetical protein
MNCKGGGGTHLARGELFKIYEFLIFLNYIMALSIDRMDCLHDLILFLNQVKQNQLPTINEYNPLNGTIFPFCI